MKDDETFRTADSGSSAKAASKMRIRPVDAASLIIIDRTARGFRVLMGKRHSRHVFMPDTYVFPGGRRERHDSRAKISLDLPDDVAHQLRRRTPASSPRSHARALAVAAIRETREETGLRANQYDEAGTFDLSCLRFLARAVTPPGQVRRFDARFFACFVEESGIDPDAAEDSDELTDLRWVELPHIERLPVPRITRAVLEDLERALSGDRRLRRVESVPFYHMLHGVERRDLL